MGALAPLYTDSIVNYLRGAGAPIAIAALYLDLYDGDPLTTGASVLEDLTGSAMRTNVASSFGASDDGTSTNTSVITVTTSASQGANVAYVAFFSAATSGNLIFSNLLTTPQVISMGNGVSFAVGSISINLTS